MSRNRESNYDILRILSTFGVVLLHVSGSFLQCDEGKVPLNCHFPVMLLNHLVRFAVPCFLMLSGAFLLAEERNADYQYFYRKSFRNIGITGGVFCLLYLLYRAAKLLAGVLFRKHAADALWPGLMEMFKSLLTGQPFFHLWYLFTLLGLYFAVPVVIRLAADLRAGG